MRRLSLAALLLIGLLSLLPAVASAQIQPSDAEVRAIAHKLQCPVCEGQNVGDSNSGLAQDMRDVIRTKLAAGESERQILDFFIAAYGEGILTEPPKTGASLGVWVMPVVALVVGLAAMAMVARSWLKRPSPVTATPAVDPGVADELRRYREAAR